MYTNLLFALSEIRIDELRREAQNDRLRAQLPQAPAMSWRSGAAQRVRAFADWLEPRLEPAPHAIRLEAAGGLPRLRSWVGWDS